MYKFLKIILTIFLWGVLIYCGVVLWNIGKEYFGAGKVYDQLADQYVSSQSTAPKPQRVEDEVEDSTDPTEKIWDEYAPIDVDFDALLDENSDVVGWLYCEDTVINYPIVQGPDNNYYLDKLLNKTFNICGTLFVDYRNNRDFSHYQNILYGHKMKNGSMFGSIPGYKKQEYYEEHPVMYLMTPEQDYKVVLIAGYVVPSNASEYMIAENEEERDMLIEKARAKSTFQADVEILETDRLLTMSTCVTDYQSARYMLLGVMREIGPYQHTEDTSEIE